MIGRKCYHKIGIVLFGASPFPEGYGNMRLLTYLRRI